MACKNCPSGVNMRGGTGAPPPYFYQSQSYTGATSNGLDYNTALEFCYPIPGAPFNLNTEPPRNRCGSYIRDLKDFPLNQATTTDGNIRTFGTSEMVLVFVKFRNYPRSGGECIIDFHRPDGSILWSTGSMAIPAPSSSWEWWESWFWACIGKFDASSGFSGDEIIEPGNYIAMVRSSFGTAEIDYHVVDTGCLPYWQCEQPLNGYMSDGCGHRQIGNCNPVPVQLSATFTATGPGSLDISKNGSWVMTATSQTTKIPYVAGDTFTLHARPDAAGRYVKMCDSSNTCVTTTTYSFSTSGQILPITCFFEKIPCVPNWKCSQVYSGIEVDGCGNTRNNSACIFPGTKLTLTADKGSYSGTETPIFTATYDPALAGKDVNLLLRGSGGTTVLQTKTATANGVSIFNYKPSNAGTFTFAAQICSGVLSCEMSTDLTISFTGDDLPCEDWDVACMLEKQKIPWGTVGMYAAGVYILGQLIGKR